MREEKEPEGQTVKKVQKDSKADLQTFIKQTDKQLIKKKKSSILKVFKKT